MGSASTSAYLLSLLFQVCEAGLRAIVATLGKLKLTTLKLNLCGCEEGSHPLQAFEISQALAKMPHLQSLPSLLTASIFNFMSQIVG